MSNKYVFYAAGSFESGYGHLYRVLGINNEFLQRKKSLFLYQNDIQKNFYQSKKLQTQKIDDFNLNEKFIFIADTKEKNIFHLDSLIENSSISICIDTLNKWVKKFDKIVIPNFYFNPKDHSNIYDLNKSIYFGTRYCILRKNFSSYTYKHKYLLTFGGSDPNNISRKILDIIYNKVNPKNISVILGKGALYRENELKKKFPKITILKDVASTFEVINNSEIIFTALGTTIQEIEAANKKAVICFNYLDDIKDFEKILLYTKNKHLWLNGGYYKKLNKSSILGFLEDASYEASIVDDTLWGGGWKEILDL